MHKAVQIAAAHLQNPDLVVALTAAQCCHHLSSYLLEQAQVGLQVHELLLILPSTLSADPHRTLSEPWLSCCGCEALLCRDTAACM